MIWLWLVIAGLVYLLPGAFLSGYLLGDTLPELRDYQKGFLTHPRQLSSWWALVGLHALAAVAWPVGVALECERRWR